MQATLEPATVLVMPDRGWFVSGLGEAIRRRRKALGLTQVELAARTGADQTTISAIETGRRQWPTREVREAIARALGWTNLQLLAAAGEVDPQEAGAGASSGREEELQAIVRSLDDVAFKEVRDFALFKSSSSRAR